MRIARWNSSDGSGEGFVIEREGIDCVAPFGGGVTVAEVLNGGLDYVRELAAGVEESTMRPLTQVRLRAPLDPSSIRDFVTFEEHVEGVSGSVDGKNEVVPQWYDAPTFYFTNPHTTLATDDVLRPPETERLDFELELAAVIGGGQEGRGENLDSSAAEQYIFGYTIMNDWSARDLQAREMKVKLGPCKGKDFGTTLGPWIVTADQVHQHLDEYGFLSLRGDVYVNGERIGHDSFSNMGWTFPELVSYASRNSLVVPGDVLGSGTVGNGGCLAELWGRGRDVSALKPSDEVRMVVEGIGEIINVVGDLVSAPSVPEARQKAGKN